MSIKKKFLKSKPVCKVTFKLDKRDVPHAEKVYVVGEFNDWAKDAAPMKSLKAGGFTATLDLESGREYQFRYLINGKSWINEAEADKYVETPFQDAQNSVIVV